MSSLAAGQWPSSPLADSLWANSGRKGSTRRSAHMHGTGPEGEIDTGKICLFVYFLSPTLYNNDIILCNVRDRFKWAINQKRLNDFEKEKKNVLVFESPQWFLVGFYFSSDFKVIMWCFVFNIFVLYGQKQHETIALKKDRHRIECDRQWSNTVTYLKDQSVRFSGI